MKQVTPSKLSEMKSNAEKITALTAYDVQTARLLDRAGVEVILVGDSLGMVVLGYENTVSVTMEEMLHHTKAVTRGVERALVIADMPFMSYQVGIKEALNNASRFLKEAGAKGVKIEGGRRVLPQVTALVNAGIPVMGHLGLTPQSVLQLGGFKVQGKERVQAEQLVVEAQELEAAGVFSLVLECIPRNLAKKISENLTIPTIGIGAGGYCDGQILVIQDLLGMDADFQPKFVRRYANLQQMITKAVDDYIIDVKTEKFPSLEESFQKASQQTQLYSGGVTDANCQKS